MRLTDPERVARIWTVVEPRVLDPSADANKLADRILKKPTGIGETRTVDKNS